MDRSRSPKRRELNVQFQEHIVGDFPGRVYIDVEVTAHIETHQVGYALALYNRSSEHLILADVELERYWQGKGICTRLVETLFRLVGEKYKTLSFAIDVRPRGSEVGPRACACYVSAIRRAFDGHLSRLNLEFENGRHVSDGNAVASACEAGNLQIEGELRWDRPGSNT